jgi:hypothetical protein
MPKPRPGPPRRDPGDEGGLVELDEPELDKAPCAVEEAPGRFDVDRVLPGEVAALAMSVAAIATPAAMATPIPAFIRPRPIDRRRGVADGAWGGCDAGGAPHV